MKFNLADVDVLDLLSPPARGAWIEIIAALTRRL